MAPFVPSKPGGSAGRVPRRILMVLKLKLTWYKEYIDTGAGIML